jgi:hypothetical protein
MTTTLARPGEILSVPVTASQFEVDAETIKLLATLADCVFFTSLIPEEGQTVRVAVVYHQQGAEGLAGVYDASPYEEDPPLTWDVTSFRPIPLSAATLAKFSRGLEYGAQLVVIGRKEDALYIEGVARRLPRTDGGDVLRLAAPRPGVLAFERGFRELLRFEDGKQVPSALDVIGQTGPIRAAIGAITKDPSREELFSKTDSAIRRLIQKMRATRAGGILALLPEEPKEAVLSDIVYRRNDSRLLSMRIRDEWDRRCDIINDMFRNALTEDNEASGLQDRNAMRDITDAISNRDAMRDAADVASERLEAAINDVAQLSAIDGAVLAGPAGPGLAIYGAGYKIPTPKESEESKENVVLALDVAAERTTPYDIRQHGTRHRAAVSFAHVNPGGVAFVCSEDGPVKCTLRIGDHVALWPVRISET